MAPTILQILVVIDAAIIPVSVVVYFCVGYFQSSDIKSSRILPWLLYYAMISAWTFLYTYLVIVKEIRKIVLDTLKNERRWEVEREIK